MLVSYPNSPLPLGLAVTQWRINGHLRTFVLFPFDNNGGSYTEVGCAIEEDGKLQVIAEPIREWGLIKNGFGDEMAGYTFSDETAGDLYWVWDEGAATHPDKADRLYAAFAELISEYTPAANDYLRQ